MVCTRCMNISSGTLPKKDFRLFGGWTYGCGGLILPWSDNSRPESNRFINYNHRTRTITESNNRLAMFCCKFTHISIKEVLIFSCVLTLMTLGILVIKDSHL